MPRSAATRKYAKNFDETAVQRGTDSNTETGMKKNPSSVTAAR
jgi:hypothetical protein